MSDGTRCTHIPKPRPVKRSEFHEAVFDWMLIPRFATSRVRVQWDEGRNHVLCRISSRLMLFYMDIQASSCFNHLAHVEVKNGVLVGIIKPFVRLEVGVFEGIWSTGTRTSDDHRYELCDDADGMYGIPRTGELEALKMQLRDEDVPIRAGNQ